MKGHRIDFLSADAARFNALRDQWRSAASSCALPKAALRLASILPAYVNREYGYAFPTDYDLARAIEKDVKTVKRGVAALDDAGLIDRQTMVKRDEKGEAVGRLRRIYLTLPEVKGQKVKGQPEVKGQNPGGEGTPVCPNIPDRITPDKETRREKKVSAYVPARENVPSPYRNDPDFLETFDRTVMAMADGRPIGAGEIERIVHQAFDHTTNSSDRFMPFHWREVCALRSSETATWFRGRVGQLIHRRAA